LIVSFLFIPLAILAYKNFIEHRKNGSTKWFSFSLNRNAAEQ